MDDHIALIPDETRRRDCETLVAIMGKVTKKNPKMWGNSIIGFDSYHYKYESGHEGDMCVTGFSSRKGNLSIHLLASGPEQEGLLEKLGRHKMGKSCLYVRRLSDIDIKVLERLIVDSVSEMKRRYG